MSCSEDVGASPEGERASLCPEVLPGGVGNRDVGNDYKKIRLFISYIVLCTHRQCGDKRYSTAAETGETGRRRSS
jgi:hypothetical protein